MFLLVYSISLIFHFADFVYDFFYPSYPYKQPGNLCDFNAQISAN